MFMRRVFLKQKSEVWITLWHENRMRLVQIEMTLTKRHLTFFFTLEVPI